MKSVPFFGCVLVCLSAWLPYFGRREEFFFDQSYVAVFLVIGLMVCARYFIRFSFADLGSCRPFSFGPLFLLYLLWAAVTAVFNDAIYNVAVLLPVGFAYVVIKALHSGDVNRFYAANVSLGWVVLIVSLIFWTIDKNRPNNSQRQHQKLHKLFSSN